MTAITSTLLDPTGAPLAGERVTAVLVAARALADGSGSVVGEASTTTDAGGDWTLNLTPTDSFADPAAHYLIREAGAAHRITVPAAGGPHQLADVLVDPPTVSPLLVGLSRAVADALYVPLAGYSAWTALAAFAAGIGQTADAAMDPGGCRTEPGGLVRLRGALDATGVIAAGAVAFTLPAGHWPAKTRRVPVRLATTMTRLTVAPDGTCALSNATAAGNQLLLDGITFTL